MNFEKMDGSDYVLLCLGAHSDDIEIGCGGTVLRLIDDYENIIIHWIVLSEDGERGREAIISSNNFLKKTKKKNVILKNYQSSFFPFIGSKIKSFFIQLKKTISPDIIFTHYRHDLHQDHRLVSDLTWQTFRNHLILEYEIPKYDGDLGTPNFFVHLDEKISLRKVQYILESFESQSRKKWFSKEIFFSLLQLRGLESSSPSRYAEAFYCRKLVL